MTEHDSELRVVSQSRDGRRRYDEKGKRALVEAALRPGVSVARLAQEHGVNANLLRKWITKYLLERESSRCAQATQDSAVVVDPGDGVQVHDGVPATVHSEVPAPAFVPVVAAAAAAPSVPPAPIAFALRVRLPNGVEFNLGQAGIDELSTLVQMFGRLPCSGSTTN
jgi:transposase